MGDVFIIGAGASVPYGFPDGFELIQKLRGLKYNDELIRKLYKTKDAISERELSPSGIIDMRVSVISKWESRIKESVILTIDQFLKNHKDEKDFYEFGKIIIANLILEYEAMAKIPNKKRGGLDSIDWIQYLLTEIDTSEDWESKLLNSSFISYNYDRVLEIFIQNYLRVDKNLTPDEAAEFIKNMNIYHINGYIGDLQTVTFGRTENLNLPEIANSFRTVWDQSSEYPILNEAKEKIIESEKIYILGTSFIKENFEVIGLTNETGIADKKEIHATGYKLSKYQIRRAISMIGEGSISDRDENNWCVRDMTAKDLIIDFYQN